VEEGRLTSARAPRRRPVWRSLLGAALALLYAAAFAAAYADYLGKAGEWLADLPLLLVALPFTYTLNLLSNGAFSLSGDETFKIVLAAIFCCALAYGVGAVLEFLARTLFGLALQPRS
jgi:uncharacterized membrane protein